jgi:hypothetical protein
LDPWFACGPKKSAQAFRAKSDARWIHQECPTPVHGRAAIVGNDESWLEEVCDEPLVATDGHRELLISGIRVAQLACELSRVHLPFSKALAQASQRVDPKDDLRQLDPEVSNQGGISQRTIPLPRLSLEAHGTRHLSFGLPGIC